MSPQADRSNNRLRKHKKTFTGCWTCRTRKVKCDEARPSCGQCTQKSVHCGGYAVRLRWLPPGFGLEDDPQQLSNSLNQCKSQRSRIISDPIVAYQVDDILVAIDAVKSGRVNQQNDKTPVSKYVRGFGVFDSKASEDQEAHVESSPATQAPPAEQQSISSIPSCMSAYMDDDDDDDDDGTLSNTQPQDVPTSYLNDHLHMNALGSIERAFIEPLDRLSFGTTEDDLYLDQLPQVNPFDIEYGRGSQAGNHVKWQLDLTSAIPRSLSPEYLPREHRFLMNYYSNRVVHLFAVVDNPKSPWNTVHLPRVLQSAGELALQGCTSPIRAALRNSILSISAFHMSKHVRCQSKIEESVKWSRDAMGFHGTAMKLLKDAVNAGSSSHVRPKFKELLATMLSMISINVMSGDTTSCGLHLDAANRLITEIGKRKSRYSQKAKGLHRIYYYLRTMYESTATRDHNSSPAVSEVMGASPLQPDRIAPGYFVPSDLTAFHEADEHSYETIYAIPQHLLIFLNETTTLVNKVTAVREISGGTAIPSPLSEQCDDLEMRIMDWQADEGTTNRPSTSTANLSIIRYLTQAFHQALIIYFAQHIRLLGHRYLKPFVESVYSNMEAAEEIKIESQILASPLYWPAFIAASESFDPYLQDRFKRWYAQVESYAIGSMDSGIHLLEQVWAEGPSNGGLKTSLWRHIATRTETSLMLT